MEKEQGYDEVVEQKHITTSLTNQIKNNSVGHAYLFTGSRGCGKTSVAKIILTNIFTYFNIIFFIIGSEFFINYKIMFRGKGVAKK